MVFGTILGLAAIAIVSLYSTVSTHGAPLDSRAAFMSIAASSLMLWVHRRVIVQHLESRLLLMMGGSD